MMLRVAGLALFVCGILMGTFAGLGSALVAAGRRPTSLDPFPWTALWIALVCSAFCIGSLVSLWRGGGWLLAFERELLRRVVVAFGALFAALTVLGCFIYPYGSAGEPGSSCRLAYPEVAVKFMDVCAIALATASSMLIVGALSILLNQRHRPGTRPGTSDRRSALPVASAVCLAAFIVLFYAFINRVQCFAQIWTPF